MGQITKSRKQRLRACESVLIEHMEEFVRVGVALAEIKVGRLYEEDGYPDWKAYLKANERFGFKSVTYADYVISSATLRKALPAPKNGKTASSGGRAWTERSVRELSRLKSTSRAQAVAARVLKEIERVDKDLSSAVVRKHVDKALGVKRGAAAPPRKKPEFHEMISRWSGQLEGIADVIDGVPDDALELFGRDYPQRAEKLAAAIERLEKCLELVWATLPE